MSEAKRCYCCDTETNKTWRKSKRWAEGEPLCNGCGTSELRGKSMKEVRAKRAAKELEPTPVPTSAKDDDPDIDVGTGEQLDIEKEIEKVTPQPLVLTPDEPKKRGRPKKVAEVAPEPKAKKATKEPKQPKEPKPEKIKEPKPPKPVKPAKEPKPVKPPKAPKEPKQPKEPKPKKVKEPKPPKIKGEKKASGRKRVIRTADNLPATKECPKCKKTGDLEEMFGTRLMNEKVVPQSQCRSCRREAAARTNLKKKSGNVAFNKMKEADKALQEKKVVSKPLNRAKPKASDEQPVKAPKAKKTGPKVTMPPEAV